MIYLSGGWMCACRSLASFGRYGKRRSKVGRSGYARVIGQECVKYLACVCVPAYLEVGVGGSGQV